MVDVVSDARYQVVGQVFLGVGLAQAVVQLEALVQHLSWWKVTCIRAKPWVKLWYETEL